MGWIRRVSPKSSHERYLQEISPGLRAVQPACVCRPVHRDNHQRSTKGTHVREWTAPDPVCAAPTFSMEAILAHMFNKTKTREQMDRASLSGPRSSTAGRLTFIGI